MTDEPDQLKDLASLGASLASLGKSLATIAETAPHAVPWDQFLSEILPDFECSLVTPQRANAVRLVVREIEAVDLADIGQEPRHIATTADLGPADRPLHRQSAARVAVYAPVAIDHDPNLGQPGDGAPVPGPESLRRSPHPSAREGRQAEEQAGLDPRRGPSPVRNTPLGCRAKAGLGWLEGAATAGRRRHRHRHRNPPERAADALGRGRQPRVQGDPSDPAWSAGTGLQERGIRPGGRHAPGSGTADPRMAGLAVDGTARVPDAGQMPVVAADPQSSRTLALRHDGPASQWPSRGCRFDTPALPTSHGRRADGPRQR